ncbi:hypothetical protein K437DRAFT_259705 [Tilletiaria anomala UBC 951]|uniref:Uncharacterized protein n=1 Tax=Tilletiaria anomala (strain ATCC 24038 / CBS 436.72 / UBC 951) TaxID=1037660 RepID=A0A066V7F2_TILAU|nr:uncharacterized protein K437DRAFT_259705 [Tilletiaria anomala UBC 951]KDN37672.1 hypothetical protein K437DRAFT_259705 [Tilletiaria anomala UBC 951]
MPTTSGRYCPSQSCGLELSVGADGLVSLQTVQGSVYAGANNSFRPGKDFFLCKDDGLVGRHGQPTEVQVEIEAKRYVLWVEQRAPTEFGLVPIAADATEREYSNKFLGVDESGRTLTLSDSWGPGQRWRIMGM